MRKTVLAAVMLSVLAVSARAEDNRIAIDLPPDIKARFLEQMRTHMNALNDVIHLMAAGKVREAGSVASSEMATGKGKGIGRFMPPEFREMGFDYHRSAGDFARLTAEISEPMDAAGWEKAVGGVAQITARCSACHATFRVK
jgi:hypothetical protein